MNQEIKTVNEIKSIDEFNVAIKEIEINEGSGINKLVIIDFFTDWCGPCKKIAPFFASLEKKYQNILLYKINADSNDLRPIIDACAISSLPSFCYFINGKYIHKTTGANENLLEKDIVNFLNIYSLDNK